MRHDVRDGGIGSVKAVRKVYDRFLAESVRRAEAHGKALVAIENDKHLSPEGKRARTAEPDTVPLNGRQPPGPGKGTAPGSFKPSA